MEKENRDMYLTTPHLPPWRARLTAAPLARALGRGSMHYVAVQQPGMINETGRNLTVLDSIAAAGGMTPEAGTVITFLPTSSRRLTNAAGGDPACSGAAARDEVADDTPLVVNTAELDDDTR